MFNDASTCGVSWSQSCNGNLLSVIRGMLMKSTKGLDCSFGGIYPVDIGFDKHQVAFLECEIFFDNSAGLIIHHIQLELEAF